MTRNMLHVVWQHDFAIVCQSKARFKGCEACALAFSEVLDDEVSGGKGRRRNGLLVRPLAVDNAGVLFPPLVVNGVPDLRHEMRVRRCAVYLRRLAAFEMQRTINAACVLSMPRRRCPRACVVRASACMPVMTLLQGEGSPDGGRDAGMRPRATQRRGALWCSGN